MNQQKLDLFYRGVTHIQSKQCEVCGHAFFVWNKDFNLDWVRIICRACECKRNGHSFTIFDNGQRHCVVCNLPRVTLGQSVQYNQRIKVRIRNIINS